MEAEVLVVGAGPAGVAAACCVAEGGRDVLLVDESPRPGGQIWRHRRPPSLPVRASQWLGRLEATATRVITGTSVVDVESDGTLVAERGGARIRLRADTLVLATGARELFLPFPGWTLPGVLGVGAGQALVKAGADLSGASVVLAGSGPLLLQVGSLLQRTGAKVKVIAEQASKDKVVRFAASLWRFPAKIKEAIEYRSQTLGTPYRLGVWAAAAHGDDRIREVELTDGRRTWMESCELLCCSYGLVPNTELANLLDCEIVDNKVWVNEIQATSRDNIYCVGESTGIGGVEKSLVEGQMAAFAIMGQDEKAEALARSRRRLHRFAETMDRTFRPRRELEDRLSPDTIVCRCEDVKWGVLDTDWSLRQAKLYTRIGMGPCQGRVCGAALQHLCGWKSDSVRPPLKPSRLSTLIR